jgi:hypothetical protein
MIKKQIILPQHQRYLSEMGQNIKLARKMQDLETLRKGERHLGVS